jgi:hypothetical protein
MRYKNQSSSSLVFLLLSHNRDVNRDVIEYQQSSSSLVFLLLYSFLLLYVHRI